MSTPSSMPTIVFFGNERLATGISTTTPVLIGLIESGYKIAAVVTTPETTHKSRARQQLEIIDIAERYVIPLLTPTKLSAVALELKSMGAQIGVLVAYGKFVPQAVIDCFPYGIVNIHPSLLPKHRGSIPLESCILEGDIETGVSLMSLVAEMDAGPVFAQEQIALTGNETKQELADNLSRLGTSMLLRDLPIILSKEIEPTAQRGTDATYDHRLQKQDGLITKADWAHHDALSLERRVRAYAGWPRTATLLDDKKVIITAAHCIELNGLPGTHQELDGKIGIHARKGTLIIDMLIPEGRKEMSSQAYLAGRG